MRILIGEDDILIAEHLKDIVKSFGYDVIAIAHNKEDILKLIDKHKPNLALLDIRMEGRYDGIEVGEYVLNNYNFPVIYITAHSDNDIIQKALKTKPNGYIIKPFKAMDIYTAMNIAVENFTSKKTEKFILIKDGYNTIKIFLYEIIYLKSDNNYVEIITGKRTYVERISLENILSTINSEDFIRVHRSFAINTTHLKELKSSNVVVGDHLIPVSRKFLKSVKEKLLFKSQ
jgi:DNA-binding LytR/AlgR family response regulator